MKISEALKADTAQRTFEAVLVVVVLLILPSIPLGKYGGGMAMLSGSIIGAIAHFVLYGKRLRGRGLLKIVVIAAAVGAFVAIALALVLRELLAAR